MKMEEELKEKVSIILRRMKNEQTPPYVLEAKLTRKCNLMCKFCQFYKGQHFDHTKELSDKEWIRVIKEACKMGVSKFQLLGLGEALCRKKLLLNLMKIIKNSKKYGSLLTNGTLFSKNDVNFIVKIGWDNIIFSIDGPNAKIHDFLRGTNGAFKRVVKSLTWFKYYKAKHNSKFPSIGIAMVLTSLNYDKLDEMLDFGYEFGVDSLLIWPLLVITPEAKKLTLNDSQRRKFWRNLKKVEKKSREYGILTNLHQFRNPKIVKNSSEMGRVIEDEIKRRGHPLLKIPCYFPWFYILILPEGWVHSCPMSTHHVENIKNKKLPEIWNGKYLENIRSKLIEGKMLPFCKNCCGPSVLENIQIREELEKVKIE